MHSSIKIWKLIHESLQAKTPAMLLYVLESKGSSPGRQGFFMCVNSKGAMEGSIGGGIMEHKFVEVAKEKLKEQHKNFDNLLRKQVHDKSAADNQSGMICSGEQMIYLYQIKEIDKIVVEQIVQSLERNENGTFVLTSSGTINFSPSIPAKDYDFNYHSDNDWTYTEKTGYKNHLFIIGGGHCALAFSKLMSGLDFYITLYEEREELNTVLKNNFVHESILVDDYSGLGNLIPSGANQYVTIMTFGYRTDKVALQSLLHKSFTYLGVLGSKTKMDKLFEAYKEEGVDEKLFGKAHTPIGININSQTPEEIAVSIAAQIIQIKNMNKR